MNEIETINVINNPRELINRLESIVDIDVTEVFNQILLNNAISQQVPTLLNDQIGYIKPESFCRYKGMIQDIFDLEYYCSLYANETTGQTISTKYSDNITQQDFKAVESNGSIKCRQPFLCVPVPGESAWSRDLGKGAYNSMLNSGGDKGDATALKRKFENDEVDEGK